jgi:O-antigen ligase
VRLLVPRLDLLVPVVLAATIVAFAAGSSSVRGVVDVGRPGRWVFLLLLFVGAAAWASARRNRRAVPRSVLVAAVAFLAFAVESTFWSVDARLTLERAATLVLLLATATLLASACAGRADAARRLLAGILVGAATVAVLGLVVLAFDHAAAVQPPTGDEPTRYRGFGENPNTVALLLGLCLPIATWLAFHASTIRRRAIAVAVGVAFVASIAASGSRGALAAGFAGVLLVVALVRVPGALRAVSAVAVGALLAGSIAVVLVPKTKGEPSGANAVASSKPGPKPKPGYLDVQAVYPLEFDIGRALPGHAKPQRRTLFGLSGRGEAWRGALDQADERPVLGYGFGTEDHVFVDRYASFAGGLPENSYIGMYLQLGAVGLAAFLLLVGSLALAATRGLPRPEAVVGLAVLLAALVLAVAQSFVYSVGDIGTATAWICAFLGAAAVRRPGAAAA